MKVFAVGAAVALAACSAGDGPSSTTAVDGLTAFDGAGSCTVARTSPAAGAAGVAVSGALTVTWSTAVDAATVIGRVSVRTSSGQDVPVAVTLDAHATTATVQPAHSLRYWGAYTLAVADGVKTRSGRACRAAQVSFQAVALKVAPRALRPAAAHGLVRAGSYAITASSTYRGLQVYRVDGPDRISLVRELVTDVDPIGLRAAGARAYAPAGFDGVLIFDIADPARPALLARIPTAGVAFDVAPFAAGGRKYLAVAERPAGVRILDVTDARAVTDLGVVDPSGVGDNAPLSLSLQGSLLAVGNAPKQGFSLISVADPAHPRLLSSTSLGGIDGTGVALAGGVAYVAVSFYGVHSFDVSDPAHPVKVGHVDGPHGPCGFECKDPFAGLVVDGDRLWAPLQYSRVAGYALDGRGGMTPANVLPVAGSALSLVPDGGFVFVGAEEGLVVFPRGAAEGTPPTWFDPSGHGIARSTALSSGGGYLHVAASARGLQTFSIAAPLAPALVDVETTPGVRGHLDIRAAELLVTAGTIFVGDGRAGLAVFDGSTPAHPREVATAPPHDQVEAMQRAGDVLYTCDDNAGMYVYDVSSAAAPREIGHLELDPAHTACLSLRLAGHLMYVGGTGLLGVADVSDPAHPALLAETVAPDHGSFVSIDLAAGNQVLLADTSVPDATGFHGQTTRLQVFDLSDPAHPRWTWASPPLRGSGAVDAVLVTGDVVWVAAKDSGIYVYDLSAPLLPVLEGRIATPGAALALTAGKDALYVAQGEGGVGVVSLRASSGGRCDDDDDDDDHDDDHGDHHHHHGNRDHRDHDDCDDDD